MSEFNARVAEMIGWRAWSETRGQYTLAVTQSPDERRPWEKLRNSEMERPRYNPITCVEAERLGFFGRGFPLFDTDANADYSVLVFVREKWNNQRLRRFRVEFAKLATPGLASGSAMFAYYQPGMYARAALAVIDSERKDRE